ncbi:GNAT family N-acetyltransferase [Lactiplantibacillus daowaiensis]|uniref:GNAT family N-acetyltransferase n=1 Tax=Lactiplantibacillus daowaiensis TaxID=2559918 RepID=A0ABW1S2R9_9LACO
MIRLSFFTGSIKEWQQLNQYQLQDSTYTSQPLDVQARVAADPDRRLVLIWHEHQVVGVFCLHQVAGPCQYGGNQRTDLLIRALSIDDRYRGHHYALDAMRALPAVVHHAYPQVQRLILAVNHANYPAQQLYQKAQFQDTGHRTMGILGWQYVLAKKI